MRSAILGSAIVAIAALVAAAPAWAGHDNGYYPDEGGRGSPGAYYSDDTEYARVVSAVPIYRQVRVSEPRDECYDERVERPVYHSSGWGPGPGAAPIIGAVIGGLVGSRFGQGSGKAITTATGAVLGATIAERHAYAHAGREVSYVTHCRPVEAYRYEERVDGYDVAYRYHGRIYHTIMPYNPGERIRVHVDVSPVDD